MQGDVVSGKAEAAVDRAIPASGQTLDVGWIVSDMLKNSLAGMELHQQFDTACKQLHAAGLGICRAHLAVNTLHPQFKALSHTWYLSEDMNTQYYGFGQDTDAWLCSPLYYMISNGLLEMRRHLTGPEAMLDFPVLEGFAQQGFTDYRGYLAAFEPLEGMSDNPEGLAGSWCCATPGGFTRLRLSALREVELALAVVCKMHMQQQMTENILTTYLGADAGRQVRRGRIRRGDVESVKAVIWYSDMRDSTALAARLGGPEFLSDINEYFSCVAGAILENGGEVLRFIGDAVLAIFPVRSADQMQGAIKKAQAAMQTARTNMTEVNRNRTTVDKAPLSYGLGLHYGEVLYGNIGAPERLEFSVVGAAANEVARLEEMTKHLGRATLVSEPIAGHLSIALDDLGEQPVRGSDNCLRVFAVCEDENPSPFG